MKKVNLGNDKVVMVNKNFDTDINVHTLVCFDDNFSVNNHVSELLRNNKVEKIIVVGDKPKSEYNKNVVFVKNITKKVLKEAEQIFFSVNVSTLFLITSE